jgi:hypothetical protein
MKEGRRLFVRGGSLRPKSNRLELGHVPQLPVYLTRLTAQERGMNWDQVAGNWKQMTGKVKERGGQAH